MGIARWILNNMFKAKYFCGLILVDLKDTKDKGKFQMFVKVAIANFSLTLTHFSPMSHSYTPWKLQKTYGFLTIFRGYRNVTLD